MCMQRAHLLPVVVLPGCKQRGLMLVVLLVPRLGMAAAGSLGSPAGLVEVHLCDKDKG
jgi:hypothetical protein